MELTRISAFNSEGSRVLDGIMVETNTNEAIKKFRKRNPSYNDCYVVAEPIDDQDNKWREFVNTCMKWHNIY